MLYLVLLAAMAAAVLVAWRHLLPAITQITNTARFNDTDPLIPLAGPPSELKTLLPHNIR